MNVWGLVDEDDNVTDYAVCSSVITTLPCCYDNFEALWIVTMYSACSIVMTTLPCCYDNSIVMTTLPCCYDNKFLDHSNLVTETTEFSSKPHGTDSQNTSDLFSYIVIKKSNFVVNVVHLIKTMIIIYYDDWLWYNYKGTWNTCNHTVRFVFIRQHCIIVKLCI